MKKSFIPLTALALLALVSCGGNNNQNSSATPSSDTVASSDTASSSEDVVNSITITNKTELTASWPLGSADRTVNITVDPAGNVNALINSGKITVTSSDSTVVAVVGRVLQAKAAGSATITVAYGSKTDSVTVTVTGEQTAIDLYGTVHAGTLADPLDNADAIKVAEKTGETETEKYFYVSGTVEKFKDAPSSYGNVSYYLTKGASDTKSFLVYRAVLDKETYGTSTVTENDIWVGAEVVAKVKIVNYKSNTPETSSGGTIVSVKGTKPEIKTIEATVEEALAAAKALGDNTTSTDKYAITGYIVATDAKGFYLSDTKGEITATRDNFYVYNYSGDNAAKCTLNAKIKVTAYLQHYVSSSDSTKYNYQTTSISALEILEEGDAPVTAEEIDVAKAIAVGNALADGATDSTKYAITGYVVTVTYEYSETNKNMSFTLGATADATETVTVYKTSLADGTSSSAVVAGAKVKVTGYVQKFVKDETTTIEVVSGSTEVVEEKKEETKTVTVAEAVTAAKALASGVSSSDTYVITGYVTKISGAYSSQYGNMSVYLSDVLDDADAEFIAYQVACDATTAEKITNGAKVKVTGKIMNYNGIPETVSKGAATIELVEEAVGTAVTATIASSSFKVGETAQITATAGEGDTFTYTSEDATIASVTETGLVTGVAVGETNIVVTASTGRKATLSVTVLADNVAEINGFTAVSGSIGDSGYTYASDKAASQTAPVVNGSAIRLYQGGSTFTITGSETAKALVSLTLTTDGNSAGEGPFSYVYGASADSVGEATTVSEWTDHQTTLTFEGTDVKYFKLTTTGNSKTARVYLKALTLTFVA